MYTWIRWSFFYCILSCHYKSFCLHLALVFLLCCYLYKAFDATPYSSWCICFCCCCYNSNVVKLQFANATTITTTTACPMHRICIHKMHGFRWFFFFKLKLVKSIYKGILPQNEQIYISQSLTSSVLYAKFLPYSHSSKSVCICDVYIVYY